MRKIIAVGGGEIADGETFAIDKEIIAQAEKDTPQALFIPTASEDADGYIDTFYDVYGEEFGCDTAALELIAESPSDDEIAEKIRSADVVYVGGGNTRKMLNVWETYGVDDLLQEASERGTVLSGLSAGAICWFEAGHSDSESFDSDGEEWNYVRVDGLNIVEDLIYCPHYHVEGREQPFKAFMEDYPDNVGIAVDDNAALEIIGDKYRIITSQPNSHAYRVYNRDSEIMEEQLPVDEFSDLDELTKPVTKTSTQP